MPVLPVSPQEATLLDVLMDGFEGGQGSQEVRLGWRERALPLPSLEAAGGKYIELVEEARRWFDSDGVECVEGGRRCTVWPRLRIAQAWRGVVVLALYSDFDAWWRTISDAAWSDVHEATRFAHSASTETNQALLDGPSDHEQLARAGQLGLPLPAKSAP